MADFISILLSNNNNNNNENINYDLLSSLYSSSSSSSSSSSNVQLSEREILSFRISPLFQLFFNLFTECSSFDQIELYINILKLLCSNSDFSYQFGDFGGHIILKRWMRDFPDCIDNCCELITIIISSGCQFPMMKNILHQEHIMIPSSYEFFINNEQSSPSQSSFHVLLRQIPQSMHGEGQIAVGYIIWSAAIILSRWICNHTSLFQNKSVLEIGAGTGLCGIVASACNANVTITDYTDIILKNISQNIQLNTGNHLINGTVSCLNDKLPCQVLLIRLFIHIISFNLNNFIFIILFFLGLSLRLEYIK